MIDHKNYDREGTGSRGGEYPNFCNITEKIRRWLDGGGRRKCWDRNRLLGGKNGVLLLFCFVLVHELFCSLRVQLECQDHFWW